MGLVLPCKKTQKFVSLQWVCMISTSLIDLGCFIRWMIGSPKRIWEFGLERSEHWMDNQDIVLDISPQLVDFCIYFILIPPK